MTTITTQLAAALRIADANAKLTPCESTQVAAALAAYDAAGDANTEARATVAEMIEVIKQVDACIDGFRINVELPPELQRRIAALAAYDAQQEQPIDAAAALVHAYAHGKANGDHVDWEYVNEAYNLARAEVGEERCAEIEALYGDTT